MDKIIAAIKAFFGKKPVVITEGVLVGLCAIGLAIGGYNAEAEIVKYGADGLAILAALESIITIIQGIFKSTKKTE